MSDRFTLKPFVDSRWPETSRFMVHGTTEDGRRVRRSFATKFAAQQEAARLNAEANRTGILGALTDEQRVEAERCMRLCAADGRTLGEVVAAGLDHLARMNRCATVSEAYKHMMEAKKDRSRAYLDEIRKALTLFLSVYGGRKMDDITGDELRGFIETRPVGPKSRNNLRGYLATLWAHAVRYRLAAANPVRETAKASETPQDAGILTPAALRAAIAAARVICAESVTPIVIQAFAGLRTIEVERLDWREVNMEDGHITIAAWKAKTRTRRNVDMSPNLRAFLAPVAKRDGRVMASCHPVEFPKIRAAVIEDGHAWPANALRHSFCSYRLTQTSDESLTALEAGHTVDMLHRHYKGLASKKAASEWWAILPE